MNIYIIIVFVIFVCLYNWYTNVPISIALVVVKLSVDSLMQFFLISKTITGMVIIIMYLLVYGFVFV